MGDLARRRKKNGSVVGVPPPPPGRKALLFGRGKGSALKIYAPTGEKGGKSVKVDARLVHIRKKKKKTPAEGRIIPPSPPGKKEKEAGRRLA